MKTKHAARVYAAKINRELAAHAFDNDFGFASHVTLADKQAYAERNIKLAENIEAGKLDNNFTVCQRMNYYLTGECVPFLT